MGLITSSAGPFNSSVLPAIRCRAWGKVNSAIVIVLYKFGGISPRFKILKGQVITKELKRNGLCRGETAKWL
jgi:hypothetical protein